MLVAGWTYLQLLPFSCFSNMLFNVLCYRKNIYILCLNKWFFFLYIIYIIIIPLLQIKNISNITLLFLYYECTLYQKMANSFHCKLTSFPEIGSDNVGLYNSHKQDFRCTECYSKCETQHPRARSTLDIKSLTRSFRY